MRTLIILGIIATFVAPLGVPIALYFLHAGEWMPWLVQLLVFLGLWVAPFPIAAHLFNRLAARKQTQPCGS